MITETIVSFMNRFRLSKLKNKPMFDLNIILDFNLPYAPRAHYLNGEMEKRGFSYLGSGRHRRTYLSLNGRYVLKFPHCKSGLYANRDEARIWKESFTSSDDIAYAPCRLIQDSILMMAAVVEAYGGTDGCDNARDQGLINGEDAYGSEDVLDSLPSWVEDIDACQVGLLRNGKLVAYDYGM